MQRDRKRIKGGHSFTLKKIVPIFYRTKDSSGVTTFGANKGIRPRLKELKS